MTMLRKLFLAALSPILLLAPGSLNAQQQVQAKIGYKIDIPDDFLGDNYQPNRIKLSARAIVKYPEHFKFTENSINEEAKGNSDKGSYAKPANNFFVSPSKPKEYDYSDLSEHLNFPEDKNTFSYTLRQKLVDDRVQNALLPTLDFHYLSSGTRKEIKHSLNDSRTTLEHATKKGLDSSVRTFALGRLADSMDGVSAYRKANDFFEEKANNVKRKIDSITGRVLSRIFPRININVPGEVVIGLSGDRSRQLTSPFEPIEGIPYTNTPEREEGVTPGIDLFDTTPYFVLRHKMGDFYSDVRVASANLTSINTFEGNWKPTYELITQTGPTDFKIGAGVHYNHTLSATFGATIKKRIRINVGSSNLESKPDLFTSLICIYHF